MRRALATLLLVALALTGAGAAAVMFAETSFIYFPMREFDGEPTAMGQGFEDVALVAEDGTRLHGLFLPAREPRMTFLVSHGNAGNISHRVERALLFRDWLQANVLLYDYRGYGRSEGKPDEPGTYKDARAAYRHLVEARAIDPDRLVLFGESLGSAVTVELATSHRCGAVVLEAPFTSMPEMARVHYPIFPIGSLIRNRYDNVSKMGRLRAPLLVMHGNRDSVVPFWMGERVFQAAAPPKEFFRIEGADHNDTYVVGGASYRRALGDFLTRHLGAVSRSSPSPPPRTAP